MSRTRAIARARKGLHGERGLITAVIAQAYVDWLKGYPDAVGYFASDIYRHHLTLLGLSPDLQPSSLMNHRRSQNVTE